MEGYIKLYRKLLDNPVFQNEKLLKIFIWCLLKASHSEHEQLIGLQTITLQPGQFIFGRLKAAEELHMKESTIYKYIKWLEKNGICNIKSNNKFSLVTITNWELYQLAETKGNSKSNNNVTTKEQQRNTNKNVKNDKNEKNIYIGLSENMKNAINDFIEMRKKIRKPMTERAIQIMLKKLDGLAKDETTKIAILEQSIEKGWLSVYPLKEDKPAQKQPTQATNFKQRTYSDEFYKKIINRF